jgi:hypothetical protein
MLLPHPQPCVGHVTEEIGYKEKMMEMVKKNKMKEQGENRRGRDEEEEKVAVN